MIHLVVSELLTKFDLQFPALLKLCAHYMRSRDKDSIFKTHSDLLRQGYVSSLADKLARGFKCLRISNEAHHLLYFCYLSSVFVFEFRYDTFSFDEEAVSGVRFSIG